METMPRPRTDSAVRAPWWALGVGVPLLFVSVSLLGVAISRALDRPSYNYDTETAKLLLAGIPASLVMLLILVAVTRWSRQPVQGPRIRWTRDVWLVVGTYTAFGVITFAIAKRGGGHLDLVQAGGLAVACLLVGINEELAYRGLSLGGLARRLPVFWAVVSSALLFGLSHIINLLAGSAPSLVAKQVIFTTCGGLLFGWLYVFSGRNLWLIAIVHAVHDFLVVTPSVTGATPLSGEGLDAVMNWALGPVGGFISAGLPVMFTIYGWQRYRGMSLEQALLSPISASVAGDPGESDEVPDELVSRP
jgi:membrane protease YdiL (CAAX protease family)